MTTTRTFTIPALAVALLGLLLSAAPAGAQDDLQDLFAVPPESPAFLEFGTGDLPQIPADFFGPGSDPFDGQVVLEGTPPSIDPLYTDAALFFERSGTGPLPEDPAGTEVTVDFQLLALDLVGVAPIEVTYLGGSYSEFWRLRMETLPASVPGSLTFTKADANGGTFVAEFEVPYHFTFTREGDGDTRVLFCDYGTWPPFWCHGDGPYKRPPSGGLAIGWTVREEPDGRDCPVGWVVIEDGDYPPGAFVTDLIPAGLVPPPEPFSPIGGDEPNGTGIVFGPSDNPELPPDFFGPGSEPFNGPVPLKGKPPVLGIPDKSGDEAFVTGRADDPFDKCDLPVPDPVIVDFELAGLDLVSIDPIEVRYTGVPEPELWDVRMELSPNAATTGVLTVTKTHDNGGTFDSFFFLNPRYTFTRIPDGVEVVLDAPTAGTPAMHFDLAAGAWVHTVNPDLDLLATADGFFVAGVEEMIPGDPLSQVMSPLSWIASDGGGTIAVQPTVDDVSGVWLPSRADQSLMACPNPFNPSTTLRYELKSAGPVSLRIYDLRGHLVRTLSRAEQAIGRHEVTWRGVDDRGRGVASGVYVGVLETREGVTATKLAVIK